MGGIGEEVGASAVWQCGTLQGDEKCAWTRTVLTGTLVGAIEVLPLAC